MSRLATAMKNQELDRTLRSNTWLGAMARGDWDHAIYVARALQKIDTNTVRAAFAQHPRNEMWADLVLLRLMFEVERLKVVWAPRRWSTIPDFDTVSGSWPLDWNGGNPRLVAQYDGFNGFPYEMAEEYDFLLRTTPPRNLDRR